MPKFIVVNGSVKKDKKVHQVGAVLELPIEEVERINRKGIFLELAETHAAKAKAESDAKAAIEKAEKDAAEKLKKGGGK